MLNTTSNQDQHFDLPLNLHNNIYNLSPPTSKALHRLLQVAQFSFTNSIDSKTQKQLLSAKSPTIVNLQKHISSLLSSRQPLSTFKKHISSLLPSRQLLSTFKKHISSLLPSRQPLSTFKKHISSLLSGCQLLSTFKKHIPAFCQVAYHCQLSKNIFPARTLSSDNAVKPREHIGWTQVIFQCSSETTNYSSLRMQLCKIWLCNAPIKNIIILQY